MEKQYTLVEAADLLNISLRLLRKRVYEGYIRAKKYEGSNRLYISESEIQRTMEKMK